MLQHKKYALKNQSITFFFSALLLSLGVPAQVVWANCSHETYINDDWGWDGFVFLCSQGDLTALPHPDDMKDYYIDCEDYYYYDDYAQQGDYYDCIGYDSEAAEGIIITDNPIQAIARSNFQGLTSVEFIELSGTQISELPAFVFAEMPNMKHLLLTGSHLTTIHVDSLRGIPNLIHLSLKGNRIKCLPVNVFSDLPDLWYLDLSDNQLEYIAPGTLNGMSAYFFFLDNNKLQCFHADSL